MLINANNLIDVLDEDDVIKLMRELGSDDFKEFSDGYIFKSICHDSDTYKLYYYTQRKKFYCFRCAKQMSIYDLIMKVNDCDFKSAFKFLKSIVNGYNRTITGFGVNVYKSVDIDEVEVEDIPPIKKQYLYNAFQNKPIQQWLDEGISKNAMSKFNIRYDNVNDRAIIPVFQKEKCIGIRTRCFKPTDVFSGRKYIPLFYDNECYNFKTSSVLYGLDEVIENVKKYRTIVLVEGEKSVLKYETFYPHANCCVAMFGSNLSMVQKRVIYDLGVEEVILAMDKEFEKYGDTDSIEYEQKIIKNFKGLEDKCKCSYIIDKEGLLDMKDSPIDKNKEVFEKLMKSRVYIN